MINLRSCVFFSFLFFFFFNDGTTGNGEKNCPSLHVSKNRDNFQVSWTWAHSVKFPAIKRWSATVQSRKKKKSSSRRIYSCFFTHNGITTPKTTREGQESTTKTSLHLAWPPKFKNQVLSTPRAQNRFLDLGLLLRGGRPKSRSLPGRVEVIHPVVRACTTFWLTSTRITLTRVHRPRALHCASACLQDARGFVRAGKAATRYGLGSRLTVAGRRPISSSFRALVSSWHDNSELVEFVVVLPVLSEC